METWRENAGRKQTQQTQRETNPEMPPGSLTEKGTGCFLLTLQPQTRPPRAVIAITLMTPVGVLPFVRLPGTEQKGRNEFTRFPLKGARRRVSLVYVAHQGQGRSSVWGVHV